MKSDRSKTIAPALPIREKTYRALKKQLLAGQFDPKQRLTEEALARQLGVSRTPIREALHKLELEGLVEAAGARGFCVPEGSVEEMNELFEIRAILEGHALVCLCNLVARQEFDSLQALVDNAEQACDSGELTRVFEFNTKFHDQLYRLLAQKKPRLYSMIEDIRDNVLRYRKNTLIHLKGVRRSIAGHKKILMALNLGDPNLCERIMREHIKEAQEDTTP